MDIQVYSMAQKQVVALSSVRRVLTDCAATAEQFYENCLNLFPLVLAPMTPAEIEGQRNLVGWRPRKQNKNTDCYRATEILNAISPDFDFGRMIIPAEIVPATCEDLPLLPSWHQWGRGLFGGPAFAFGFNQTLRRDAVPMQPTIGNHLHSDAGLDNAFYTRQLSLFSICADPALEAALPPPQNWWTTQWHDMRPLQRDEVLAYEATIETDSDFAIKQAQVAARCPAVGLPANHHVVMPSWFLHRASNFFDAPEEYDELFPPEKPQPRAYVSHAILYAPGVFG